MHHLTYIKSVLKESFNLIACMESGVIAYKFDLVKLPKSLRLGKPL